MTIEQKFEYYKKYGILFIDGTVEQKFITKHELLVRLLKQL